MTKVVIEVSGITECLSFTDNSHTHLTVPCQEHIRSVLMAYTKAYVINAEDFEKGAEEVYKRYFESLAAFMDVNPRVFIEATLLKPDICQADSD